MHFPVLCGYYPVILGLWDLGSLNLNFNSDSEIHPFALKPQIYCTLLGTQFPRANVCTDVYYKVNNTFEMRLNKQVTRWVSWKSQGETAVLKEPGPTAVHLWDWNLGVCLHGVHVQYGYRCIGCILSVMLAVRRTSGVGGWNGVREGTGLVNRETAWQQMDCWTTKETSCVCVWASVLLYMLHAIHIPRPVFITTDTQGPSHYDKHTQPCTAMQCYSRCTLIFTCRLTDLTTADSDKKYPRGMFHLTAKRRSMYIKMEMHKHAASWNPPDCAAAPALLLLWHILRRNRCAWVQWHV